MFFTYKIIALLTIFPRLQECKLEIVAPRQRYYKVNARDSITLKWSYTIDEHSSEFAGIDCGKLKEDNIAEFEFKLATKGPKPGEDFAPVDTLPETFADRVLTSGEGNKLVLTIKPLKVEDFGDYGCQLSIYTNTFNVKTLNSRRTTVSDVIPKASADASSSSNDDEKRNIILGVVFGVVALVIVIIIVCVVIYKRKTNASTVVNTRTHELEKLTTDENKNTNKTHKDSPKSSRDESSKDPDYAIVNKGNKVQIVSTPQEAMNGNERIRFNQLQEFV